MPQTQINILAPKILQWETLHGVQGRRKYLKLGGARHFEGMFFLKKKGASSKHEKGPSLFIEKSWGYVPPVPPGSYISVEMKFYQMID